MKCDFCKRDESEIKSIFAPIFNEFENKIQELNYQIQNIGSIYPQNHGFIQTNFDKINKINKNVLEMKISTIFDKDELNNFKRLEPNIILLYSYIKEYTPEITNEKPLKDLVSLYIKEPTENRLKRERDKLVTQKNELTRKYNLIKNKYANFSEIEIEFEVPLNVFNYEKNIMLYIIDEMNMLSDDGIKKEIAHKLSLCPYCAYIFNNFNKEIHMARGESRKENTNIGTNDDHSSLKEWDFDNL